MKHTKSAARAAIEAARQEQRALIDDAAAMREMPPASWAERVAALEIRIFSLEEMEAAGKRHGRS